MVERQLPKLRIGVAVMRSAQATLVHAPPARSVFGLLSALLALRGNVLGWLGALLFHCLQVVSCYSPEWQFGFRSGINYSIVFLPAGATLLVNLVAVLGLALTVTILWRRYLARHDGERQAGT